MWEAYGLDNPDLLWAATAFRGGIAGQQQAPCGALSAGALALGLRHRTSDDDKEKAKAAREAANEDAEALVKAFQEKFGDITCGGLLGVDFSDDAAVKRAYDAGVFKRCDDHVRFVIEKLYELDARRNA